MISDNTKQELLKYLNSSIAVNCRLPNLSMKVDDDRSIRIVQHGLAQCLSWSSSIDAESINKKTVASQCSHCNLFTEVSEDLFAVELLCNNETKVDLPWPTIKSDPSSETPITMYQCIVCHSFFTSQDLLESHICMPEQHACDPNEQPEAEPTVPLFEQSEQLATVSKPVKVIADEEPSDKVAVLSEFLQTHSSVKHPFTLDIHKGLKCNLCEVEIFNGANFQRHVQRFHPEKLAMADKMVKKFRLESRLYKKKLRHLKKGKPFDETFEALGSKSISLDDSINSGSESDQDVKFSIPFNCQICSKKFSTERSLQIHVNETHNQHDPGSKRFSCTVCHRSHARKSALKSHMFAIHGLKMSDIEVDASQISLPETDEEDEPEAIQVKKKPKLMKEVDPLQVSKLENVQKDKIQNDERKEHDLNNDGKKEAVVEEIVEETDSSNENTASEKASEDQSHEKSMESCPDENVDPDNAPLGRSEEKDDAELMDDILFKCSECDEIHDSRDSLNAHLVAAHKFAGEDLLNDSECEKNYKVTFKKEILESGEQNLTCHICDFRFKKVIALNNHMKKFHDAPVVKKSAFFCQLCKLSCATKFSYIKHLKRKHGNNKPRKQYMCPTCPAVFSDRTLLKSHLTKHEIETGVMHHCQYCERSYKAKKHLDGHIQSAHWEEYIKKWIGDTPLDKVEIFKCELCPKKFIAKVKLTYHMNRVHKGPNFECPICHVQFTSHRRSAFEQHLASAHTEERHFVCELCGRAYKHKRHLDDHLKTHEERSHRCPICSKAFHHKRDVRVHMGLVHNDAKPFTCDKCNFKCKTAGILKTHQLVHTNERPYECQVCGKREKSIYFLREHMKARHPSETDKIQCEICFKDIRSRRALRTHMLTHVTERNFVCNLCGSAFKTSNALCKHKRTVTHVKNPRVGNAQADGVIKREQPQVFQIINSSADKLEQHGDDEQQQQILHIMDDGEGLQIIEQGSLGAEPILLKQESSELTEVEHAMIQEEAAVNDDTVEIKYVVHNGEMPANAQLINADQLNEIKVFENQYVEDSVVGQQQVEVTPDGTLILPEGTKTDETQYVVIMQEQ